MYIIVTSQPTSQASKHTEAEWGTETTEAAAAKNRKNNTETEIKNNRKGKWIWKYLLCQWEMGAAAALLATIFYPSLALYKAEKEGAES